MPRISPPLELLGELSDHCKENNLGMGSAWGEDFGIILIGIKNDSPDKIALLCAQALIEGILNGAWLKSNEISQVDTSFIVPGPDRSQ